MPSATPIHPATPAAIDRPLAGIAFLLAAGIVFAVADATAKLLAETLPVIEITWLRWVGLMILVTPMLIATRGRVLLSAAPRLQYLRALALLGSSLLFIAGLSQLPLASATTINFVSPLMVTALSIPLLGETVGARRWAAVLVGLVGVVIVVRPGSGTFGWAVLFPIVSAACWAFGIILARRLGGIDGHWTTMSYSAIVGVGILSAMVPWSFQVPTGRELGLAAIMAVTTTIGQVFTLHAYQRAPASLAAPFIYAMLIWSTGLGYLMFGAVPDGPTWVGAAIIVASGIYTAHRERVRAREMRGAVPVPAR